MNDYEVIVIGGAPGKCLMNALTGNRLSRGQIRGLRKRWF